MLPFTQRCLCLHIWTMPSTILFRPTTTTAYILNGIIGAASRILICALKRYKATKTIYSVSYMGEMYAPKGLDCCSNSGFTVCFAHMP